MPKDLDIEWLQTIASDDETRQWIEKIQYWRDTILKKNTFINNDKSFILRLGQHSLRFQASSSFSAIEVYQEVFKEKVHFRALGFSGEDADIVLDIGANQGFYTLMLKEKNSDCTVIAVEPNPVEFAILSENIKRNRVENVFIENKALGRIEGMVELEIIPQIGSIGGKKVKIPERPWIKKEFIKKINVPSMTLDALLDKYNIAQVSIMKMDVEGFEYDILKNSDKLNRIEKIVLEYHSQEIRKEIISLLKSWDFELVMEDHKPTDYYGDLYFIK